MEPLDYLSINKALWNARTHYHFESAFYGQDAFEQGQDSLNQIELDLLGDINGLNVCHVQCHFGQDSLALARRGAHVTGIDFSEEAIARAQAMAARMKLPAQFICSDVYDLPANYHQKYDLVFTSYGVLGWLPDMQRWGQVMAHLVKPGGRLILVEFHPALWMLENDQREIAYSYFNAEPIVETEQGTYADKDAPISLQSVGWNHALGEVLGALTPNFRIKTFQEFNYSPYNIFADGLEFEPGRWCVKHLGPKLPLVYAVEAVRD